MPYGRRKYKSSRRRTSSKAKATTTGKRYNRRKAYTKARVLRPKWTSAISQRAKVKFVYADSLFSRTLNAAGGFSAYYVFRGIGPYDPDYTGVGVQPYGWDQYVGDTLFSNYICPASKIAIFFHPEETYANMRRLNVSVMAMRSPQPTLTDISDVRMIPLRSSTMYDGETESTKGARLQKYSTTRQVCGVVPTDYSAEGAYNSSPGIGWYWIVHFYTDTYDDEEIDIYFDVKITYYTMLSRGNQPNES